MKSKYEVGDNVSYGTPHVVVGVYFPRDRRGKYIYYDLVSLDPDSYEYVYDDYGDKGLMVHRVKEKYID